MTRTTHMVLDWARGLPDPAPCSVVGEVGGSSRLAVTLLGEVLELHRDPRGMAVLQVRAVTEPWHGCDDTARVLARGVVGPRAVRRALQRLGY